MCGFCPRIPINDMKSPAVTESKSLPCLENMTGTSSPNTRWVLFERVFLSLPPVKSPILGPPNSRNFQPSETTKKGRITRPFDRIC